MSKTKIENNTKNDDGHVEKKIKVEVEKSPEKDNSLHETVLDLSSFQMTKLLNHNSTRKMLCMQGIFEGHNEPAVVILEKKTFPDEHVSVQKLFKESNALRKIVRNDVYGSYESFFSGEVNGIFTTIIHPATQKHIDKFSKTEEYLVEETYEMYKNITLPHLEAQQFSLNWVDNILEHKSETEHIVYEDPDEENGFIMIPDLKWDRQINTLYLLAITRKRIRSLRELNATHLPLLKNIQTAGLKAIKDKYNIHPSQIRVFFHYQPSFYHLHVHFTSLNRESPGTLVEKAHLLSTVINNLQLVSDYYQKATITFAVYKGDLLFKKFQEHKILPSDEESVVVEAEN